MTPEHLGKALLDGVSEGLVVCDASGAIRFWNRGAERIFGYMAGDAIGSSLDIIIPERLRERHWAGWRQAMSDGVTRYGDGVLLCVPASTRSGRHISIEFSITMLSDPEGRVEGVAAIIRDVTAAYEERRRLREALAARDG